MRVAGIDCGTNSIRLLVADGSIGEDDSVNMTDVVRRMEVVRLGHGVDATGMIAPEAMQRTLTMVHEYARQCEVLGVEAIRFVATSATRDASNAAEFVAGVHEAFGERNVTPEVLSGTEEAALSFLGSTGEVAATGARAPFLVVDLGGGSTEFVRGGEGENATRAVKQTSVNMGCVRMTERHFRSVATTSEEIAAATKDVDALLDTVDDEVGLEGIGSVIGLAGTITTVTAHALGLTKYDSEAIHLHSLSVEQTLASCHALITATREERAMMPFMHPGRVDVIVAGALEWSRIVERISERSGISHVITSEHDILDGIAASLLR
ncbi:Guanosine-5'-triphosphate,3'-diphosphate pyrophosphatase [Dermatophilus congolensis]|uniref:Guanosine-5'-triphosphate,3'-diphosphate pyrophosphatase n=1 Tax=Dermatophilus congolensis TaxID=1863 RepID=A0AA46BNX4_9MICO|nr:exopolyphosphatase [Dermatophilus congolensis]STD11132.1 Guanosine-5'-triphosphate,3'-diphosphate pyrophosphatase [Dermatophilus congolensis]